MTQSARISRGYFRYLLYFSFFFSSFCFVEREGLNGGGVLSRSRYALYWLDETWECAYPCWCLCRWCSVCVGVAIGVSVGVGVAVDVPVWCVRVTVDVDGVIGSLTLRLLEKRGETPPPRRRQLTIDRPCTLVFLTSGLASQGPSGRQL